MVLGTKMNTEDRLVPPRRLSKANWESDNEGVHEKVNFDDTIWGFDLAGGIKYKKPIIVTKVKFNSRAMKASIRPGDKLLEINGVPTEQMSLKEAHDAIIASGIHILLKVTAPEDKETTYHCYEDPPPVIQHIPEKPKEIPKKRNFHYKTVANWNLQWPWVVEQKPFYSETNCSKVPSRFINKNGHKLLPYNDPSDIILQPVAMRTVKLIEETVDENKENIRTP